MSFYATTLADTRVAFRQYKKEIVRLIAQMSMGIGALAVIGGTVVIVGFLTLSSGATIAVQGYNQLSGIGVEALTGFFSAYVNVRIIAPAVAGIGLSATIGAGATAQLGAMRIAEEIDALEVMGIRSVGYLASTRVTAGMIVVIPLYCVAVLMAFLAARVTTTVAYGQSTGVYDHYFYTFLGPIDLLWSFFTANMVADQRHAGPHLLRFHRHWGARRCRRGGRARRAYLADRPGVRGVGDLAVRLRAVRPLQPVGIAPWPPDAQETPASTRGGGR